MLARTIRITEKDLTKLRSLLATLSTASRNNGTYVRDLLGELDRAEVMAPDELLSGVVTLGSTAEITDLDTLESMTLTLVLPHEADIDRNKISILAPIGTAMLGYAEGDTFEWNVPGGLKRMKIGKVLPSRQTVKTQAEEQ